MARKKSLDKMIDELVANTIESTLLQKISDSRKEVVRRRRLARRQGEKMQSELLFLPPGEEDVVEAEIGGVSEPEVASKTETEMDTCLHELGHDEKEEEVKEGPFAPGQGD